MDLLACVNGMEGHGFNNTGLAVGDFGPPGLALGAILVFVVRPRGSFERTLLLTLGSVVGMFVGSTIGARFAISPFGLTTVPLLAVLSAWLHLRARAAARTDAPSTRRRRFRVAGVAATGVAAVGATGKRHSEPGEGGDADGQGPEGGTSGAAEVLDPVTEELQRV